MNHYCVKPFSHDFAAPYKKNNTHTKWEKIKDWNVEALTLNSFKCKTRLKHFAVTPHYEKCRDPLLS